MTEAPANPSTAPSGAWLERRRENRLEQADMSGADYLLSLPQRWVRTIFRCR